MNTFPLRFLETTDPAERACEDCRTIYRANHLWFPAEEALRGEECARVKCPKREFREAIMEGKNPLLVESLLNNPVEEKRVAPPEPIHTLPPVRVVRRRPGEHVANYTPKRYRE
jgi:hypothetical protein